MSRKTKILYIFTLILTVVILAAAIYINSVMPVITGYAAKNLCSNVFVSGRQLEDVEAVDLNFSFIKYTRNIVDTEGKSVTSRFLWGKSKAIFREGFGSTLIRDSEEDDLRKQVFPVDTDPGYIKNSTMWPLGDVIPDTLIPGIDKAAIDDISSSIISGDVYGGNAFAFMVLYKGFPVAEAYKQGFSSNTRFLSWSVAKSFTNALVGILVKSGKMDISKQAGVEEWKKDERNRITLNDLMQMQSGLKWNEDYGSRSDVNLMLFNEGDMSRYAVECPAEHPAGTQWLYSSGTANIISSLIRKEFDSDTSCYAFIQDQLFEKIGITDAVFEVDPSGDFVGSSYLYATARDYARFGQLYLGDGVFNGEQILPEGWTDYTRTPASASNGEYGALFWLNKSRKYPSVPEDMFSCEGHDGQMIFIIPSRELVVVVLGFSHKPDNAMDFNRLLKAVISCINK